MNFFRFFISKSFFINMVAALLVFALLAWGVLRLLSIYTLHGEAVTVPDLKGQSIEEVAEVLEQRGLRFEILDSIYDPKSKPGAVLEQEPKPEAQVKLNRMLYLTINSSSPPKVKMPDLIDVSLRQAIAILEASGLKVGNLSYVPDIAQNAVLSQEYKGRKIEAGEMVVKGSAIDLVLGKQSEDVVQVPNLVNMKVEDAITALYGSSLNPGSLVYDETVKDTAQARVYRQSPGYFEGNLIRMGSSVDLFVTQSPDK